MMDNSKNGRICTLINSEKQKKYIYCRLVAAMRHLKLQINQLRFNLVPRQAARSLVKVSTGYTIVPFCISDSDLVMWRSFSFDLFGSPPHTHLRLHPVLLLSFFIAPTLAERLVDGGCGWQGHKILGPGRGGNRKGMLILKDFKF